jgi:hypothetical protein
MLDDCVGMHALTLLSSWVSAFTQSFLAFAAQPMTNKYRLTTVPYAVDIQNVGYDMTVDDLRLACERYMENTHASSESCLLSRHINE